MLGSMQQPGLQGRSMHARMGPAAMSPCRLDYIDLVDRAQCSAYSMEYMMARVHSCHDMSCLRACVRACERTWSRSNIRTCVSSRPHREVERPGKPSKDIGNEPILNFDLVKTWRIELLS
jgi:hypothetical protein